MKLKIYVQIMLSLLIFVGANAQVIEFDRQSQSLGVIDLNNVVDSTIYCDFSFVNSGDQPLYIKYVLATCGCTTSLWSKDSYAPAERGTVRLIYNPHLRHEKSVTMLVDVYSNSLNNGVKKSVHNLKMNFELIGETTPLTPYYKLEKGGEVALKVDSSDVYDLILDRIAAGFKDRFDRQDDRVVEELAATMRDGGYWQHIDYSCFFRTNWQPIDHLSNLCTMATAYITPESEYYGSPSLFAIINEGLKYWDITDPTSHNWWYNQIGGSQVLADVLVLLSRGEKKIEDSLLGSLSAKLAKSDSRKWTGANKLDIAKHHMYRGCILRDKDLVRLSVNESFFPIHITNKEGIQEDMSYHQHGAQLYMGGYGTVFVAGIAEIAYILRGTPYELPKEKLEIFSRFMREGFFKVFRGSYIDWNVSGRGISRKNIVENIGLISVIDKMMLIDAEHAEFYKQTKERFANKLALSVGVEPENILFYRSDYMVHNRPSYQAAVRTASTRGVKAENGNGENLFSTFQSDGAFNMRKQGDEYLNVFSVWEWDKIPGVTSPKIIPEVVTSWQVKGTSKWTGGVSDGVDGAFAYMHDDHGFKATKGWFFWDNMVVALGAGITADLVDLHTTLEQSNLRGEVVFMEDERVTVDSISTTLKNPQYIIHNKITYLPLQDGTLTLKADLQSGNWAKINYNQVNAEIQKKVFNLTWEHPKSDVDASYSYIQVPDYVSEKKIDEIKKSIEFTNTTSLQAVYKKSENKAMALFYDKSTYTVGKWIITVDKPALLIVEGINRVDNLRISVVNLGGDSTIVKVKLVDVKNNETTLKVNTVEMKPTNVDVVI